MMLAVIVNSFDFSVRAVPTGILTFRSSPRRTRIHSQPERGFTGSTAELTTPKAPEKVYPPQEVMVFRTVRLLPRKAGMRKERNLCSTQVAVAVPAKVPSTAADATPPFCANVTAIRRGPGARAPTKHTLARSP